MTARVASPNGHLSVQGQGTYEIISASPPLLPALNRCSLLFTQVSDSQCPGTVAAENTFVVTWVDRPFAKIASETPVVLDPISGNYILPAVCEHVDDHVELDLTGRRPLAPSLGFSHKRRRTGRAPFQLVYNIARDGIAGGTDIIDEITFNSIQPRTRFQLHTSEAGKKYYEVKQIGDASYPISKSQQTIPRAERLLFSQEVLSRPAAAFKQRGRLSYCYEDIFASKSSSDGVVVLLGTPPFEVRGSVKDLAVGEIHEETVTISGTTWAFALPSYTFKSVGPHLVTIESVQDASHCEQAALDPLRNTMWVDVAETAAIVPYDRREHFCVGDASQFQLEGIPPWSIG
jgi:nucleoporin POM152